MIAQTPPPPYYAVIFTSVRTAGDDGYAAMAARMEALAQKQSGYLGMESARTEVGITVSYWSSPEAIKAWKEDIQHAVAQQKGQQQWYSHYHVRICRVERDYNWGTS